MESSNWNETLRVLEPEIRKVEQMEMQSWDNRTQSVLIHRLPNEILVQIFKELVLLTRYDFVPLISHVCARWRSVALFVPSLWTTFLPACRDGIEAFLERSRNAPVYARLKEGRKCKIADCWPVLALAKDRVMRLSLETSNQAEPTRMKESILAILNELPQDIEVFTIRFHAIDVNSGLWANPFHQAHQADGLLPRLRTFHCHNFLFHWGCGILRNLHSLVIKNDFDSMLSEEFLEVLLDAIESCPHLQYLELFPSSTNYLKTARAPFYLPNINKTSMPFLRTVALPASLGGAFLTRFALPAAEVVHIAVRLDEGSEDTGSDQELDSDLSEANEDIEEPAMILDAIADILYREDYPVTELSISLFDIEDRDGHFAVEAKFKLPKKHAAAPQNHHMSSLKPLASGRIFVFVPYSPGIDVTPFHITTRIMQFQRHGGNNMITKLSCQIVSDRFDSSLWKNIFDSTGTLGSLSLNGCSYDVLESALEALHFDPDMAELEKYDEMEAEYMDPELSYPFLPALQELVIRDIRAIPLSNGSDGGSDSSLAQYLKECNERTQEEIMKCLDAREKHGFRLPRIQMPTSFDFQDPFGGCGIACNNGWWINSLVNAKSLMELDKRG